jgi:hypothetical protein
MFSERGATHPSVIAINQGIACTEFCRWLPGRTPAEHEQAERAAQNERKRLSERDQDQSTSHQFHRENRKATNWLAIIGWLVAAVVAVGSAILAVWLEN